MKDIRVCDVTMKQFAASKAFSLSFKEKLETAKLLDRLGASVIEIEGITREKADSLLVKSIASLAKNSMLAVPVALGGGNLEITWKSLEEAKNARLQVEASVSPAQIEYLYRKKANAMAQSIVETIKLCAQKTSNVEFVAVDAGRSDMDYLTDVIAQAIEAGATTVTVCDTAGKMLPSEFAQFISDLYRAVPALQNIVLGVSCSNNLAMADACVIAAVMEGAGEIKTASYGLGVASTEKVAKILSAKQDACQATCSVCTTEIDRIAAQIARICEGGEAKGSLAAVAAQSTDETMVLTVHDTQEQVMSCVEKLGYDLSAEDALAVYEAFVRIATKKEKVGSLELDAIVASAALQVPPTYVLDSYVINASNISTASAHVKMTKAGEVVESIVLGDGPIDAAFHAIEKIVGCRYELDSFQIQAVTEGQEAMGEAVIKLISDGKVYSGRGISTDIIGSSIHAYINALNKIVYEEQN